MHNLHLRKPQAHPHQPQLQWNVFHRYHEEQCFKNGVFIYHVTLGSGSQSTGSLAVSTAISLVVDFYFAVKSK